jgi:hypothetical protein
MTRETESNRRPRATGKVRDRVPSQHRASGPPSAANEAEREDTELEEEIELEEDVEPEDEPIYEIGPPTPWHPNRVRMWLALSAMTLWGLALAGLFLLVEQGVTGERLVAWQGGQGSVTTLTTAVIAYYFIKRN